MMTAQVDTTQFQAALKQYVVASNKEMSAELNRRMFYVLLRAFVLLPPKFIQEAKAKAKAYVEQLRGETKTGARLVHLIAQGRRMAKGLPALTPSQIKAGESKKPVSRIRISAAAQGYLKSVVVKALTRISSANLGVGFSQFGRGAVTARADRIAKTGRFIKGRAGKPEVPPNAALAKIAAEYGVGFDPKSNVGVYGGTKAAMKGAQPGFNPVAEALLEVKVHEGQEGKLYGILSNAFQQAFNDEREQMLAKMRERGQAVCDAFSG